MREDKQRREKTKAHILMLFCFEIYKGYYLKSQHKHIVNTNQNQVQC